MLARPSVCDAAARSARAECRWRANVAKKQILGALGQAALPDYAVGLARGLVRLGRRNSIGVDCRFPFNVLTLPLKFGLHQCPHLVFE
jgi:hypothetical protein